MAGSRAIAAVLAGGAGSRLGGAKAKTQLAGRPLLSYPVQAGLEAGLETLVVAKPSTELPELPVPVVEEPEHPRHPLCGVVAALRFAARRDPAPDVLVLACDMPFLTAELLSWLARLEGAAVAEAEGRLQPLLSRCTVAQRSGLERALEEGSSTANALAAPPARVLRESELARFGDPGRLAFNVNDETDLGLASRWLVGS
jgi:molybdopterin-guanine dinucleotide biosynthesis protein A